MKIIPDKKRSWTAIPVIILWGCFGGICFAGLNLWVDQIVRLLDISCYSRLINPVFPIWEYGTCAVFLLTLGVIAALLSNSDRKQMRDVILTGVVSGTLTVITGLLLVKFITLPEYDWAKGIVEVIRIYIGWETLALFLAASIILQSLGALYQKGYLNRRPEKNTALPQTLSGRRYRPGIFFVIILAVLLVIPLPLYALPVDNTKYCMNGESCDPGLQCSRIPVPDSIEVTRTGPKTIRIGLTTIYPCGTDVTYQILLNGIDISNQARIAKSGLNVTMSPTEGLGRHDGDFVLLQGGDLVANTTNPLHFQINGTYAGTASPRVFSDQYL